MIVILILACFLIGLVSFCLLLFVQCSLFHTFCDGSLFCGVVRGAFSSLAMKRELITLL